MPSLPVSHQRKARADGRLRAERKEEEKEKIKGQDKEEETVWLTLAISGWRKKCHTRPTHTTMSQLEIYGKNLEG